MGVAARAPRNAVRAVAHERRRGDPAGSLLAVNVIGYLGETLGLGEAAGLYIAALTAARVPVTTTAVTPDLPVKGAENR